MVPGLIWPFAIPAPGARSGARSAGDGIEGSPFRLETFFDGAVDGWGMLQGRNGGVVRLCRAVVEGRWEGSQGILDGRFTYSDGVEQNRVWYLTRTGRGTYLGEADDVVGTAEVQAAGDALRWRYTLDLPADGSSHEVKFEDWMFLQDGGVVLNRSVMKKFGIRIGEAVLFFKRRA